MLVTRIVPLSKWLREATRYGGGDVDDLDSGSTPSSPNTPASGGA
jgi:hypothetical protein